MGFGVVDKIVDIVVIVIILGVDFYLLESMDFVYVLFFLIVIYFFVVVVNVL